MEAVQSLLDYGANIDLQGQVNTLSMHSLISKNSLEAFLLVA